MFWVALLHGLSSIGASSSTESETGDTKPATFADQTIPERYRGKSVRRRPDGFKEKIVAMTFDDGPDPSNTPKIIASLAAYDAKATFFVIGSYAKRHPKLIKFIAERGHVVGSHSWGHLASPTAKQAGPEIWKTAKSIHAGSGIWPSVYRPPYGIDTNRTAKAARHEGYGVVLWDRSSADTARGVTSGDIYDNVRNAQPGNIILFHDGPGNRDTVKAVPAILKTLDKRGYKFVTVPEMLRRWDQFISRQEAERALKKNRN